MHQISSVEISVISDQVCQTQMDCEISSKEKTVIFLWGKPKTDMVKVNWNFKRYHKDGTIRALKISYT